MSELQYQTARETGNLTPLMTNMAPWLNVNGVLFNGVLFDKPAVL
jgi:hypothetical protein